jgi:class 3 adenylate cyclase/pimeloyl-ACP methyl ester carboxylesterase
MADVRYCTTEDGVRIAYTVEGSGPALVICPYVLESFALDHPAWLKMLEDIGEGREVLRYDVRGSGLSQRDDVDISTEARVRDVSAVVAAAGLERFDLLAWLSSGDVAIEFAARYPEKVKRLVLYAAYATLDDAMPKENRRAMAALCRSNWTIGSQTFVDLSLREAEPALAVAVTKLWRQSTSGEMIASMLEANQDVAASLPLVKAPTLVLHRMNDTILPFTSGQRVAAGISNARLAPLPGSVNFPAAEDVDSLVWAIRSFLDEGTEPASKPAAAATAAPGGFRAVLFTDVVGHTEMMRRLGDERGRAVLREHESVTREVLRQHGGTEVKTMGDGFMASFTSVVKGVECAVALQRAFEERNASAEEQVNVRVGLNAGEPIEEDGDLFGETVILAARIAAQAEGGEVLASLAVRELCAGKGFLFADRGDIALRGFEDPARLFEISWRG